MSYEGGASVKRFCFMLRRVIGKERARKGYGLLDWRGKNEI
ncbi:hypothetical protein DYZ83_00114 [Listeria monocytogenes]|nr:hypothetical protein DYZ83_00114 [Listeria monocytogenes]